MGSRDRAPLPPDRAGFVHRHARLEQTLLHSRDAFVPEGADRVPSVRRAPGQGVEMDFLVMVQRAAGRHCLPVLALGPALLEKRSDVAARAPHFKAWT